MSLGTMHYRIFQDFQLLNDNLKFNKLEFECYISLELNYENKEKCLPQKVDFFRDFK